MSKDPKSDLKKAKELYKESNYQEALKLCKKIIKADKNNYNAFVLLGAVMREIDEFKMQSPMALKKATAIEPENPLAWQGLMNFYEKEPENNENSNELLSIYCKVLRFTSNLNKFSSLLNNTLEITLRLKDDKVCLEVANDLKQLRVNADEEKLKAIDITLAQILSQYPKASEQIAEFFEEILRSVTQYASTPRRKDYFKKLLMILFKAKRFDELIEEAKKMFSFYPDDVYPLKRICQVYYEKNVSSDEDLSDGVVPYIESLLLIEPQSTTALLAKALCSKQKGNLVESREILNKVVALNSNMIYAWIILSDLNVKLHGWEEAEVASRKTLEQLKGDLESEWIQRIQYNLVEALAKSENPSKWSLAVEECEKLLSKESSVKVKLFLARALSRLNDPKANNLLEELQQIEEARVEATVIRATVLFVDGKLEEAADLIGSALESSEAWFIFGRTHWELSNMSHSLMAFLKGLHADPHNWNCLLYLGHYYLEHGSDLDRAKKCYLKALQINPTSEKAGVGLSTTYRLLKNTEANMKLLHQMTVNNNAPKWAWLQLGLQHLDQGESTEAVRALRLVIRADPSDNHCWESLADAYLARGSYKSALKSYQRALELSPDSLYPMMQVGTIKLTLGNYIGSKEVFQSILEKMGHYVPALKGLAETCLAMAGDYETRQLLGRARDNIQSAIDSLTKAAMERSDLACIWKLLGDSCYKTARLPDKYCHLNVNPGLMKLEASEESTLKIERRDLLVLATRSYCRALSLANDSGYLWHDLACAYLAQMSLEETDNKKEIAAKGIAAAKYAVRLNPASWFHWNVLGTFCMSKEVQNYALAQHCFIMAIDREPYNAVVWNNLGTLYLHLGDPFKANEAFARAQSADPEYANCWIGQGLIAEKLHKKEAMDLFRHANQLSYHNEGAMGYAHWVITTLLNPSAKQDPQYKYVIDKLHAIPVATDALTWFTERNLNHPWALNTLGLLLERQKLYNLARKVLIQALENLQVEKHKDIVRINLARVLVQQSDYQEAIKLCKEVQTPSFISQCQLALALFKAEIYEESYETYNAALDSLAEDASEKGHVLCAMAAMAYMFQGLEEVKTLLFQCIRIQPPTIAGFLSTAALGLLHNEANLTRLVLKELVQFREHIEYRNDITFIQACLCAQTDNNNAVRTLSKSAHIHPDDVSIWTTLVRILIDTNNTSFGNCAKKALFLGRKMMSPLDVVSIACISSLSHSTDKAERTWLRSAQKTLFSFPHHTESWAVFIAALTATCNTKESKPNIEWQKNLISVVRRNMPSTGKRMAQWLLHNESKATFIADQLASTS